MGERGAPEHRRGCPARVRSFPRIRGQRTRFLAANAASRPRDRALLRQIIIPILSPARAGRCTAVNSRIHEKRARPKLRGRATAAAAVSSWKPLQSKYLTEAPPSGPSARENSPPLFIAVGTNSSHRVLGASATKSPRSAWQIA